MGEPLKVTGIKMAEYLAAITIASGAAEQIAYGFDQSPPHTEEEWMEFYRKVIRLLKELGEVKRQARQGLDVVQANHVISQHSDLKALIRELIGELEAMLADLEEDAGHVSGRGADGAATINPAP